MAELIVDAREREVLPFVEDAFAGADYRVAQISRGDFVVAQQGTPRVLAVVERKTLADYAASFADGRHASQLPNLLDMRARTGCGVFYFIEGPAYPLPARKFKRVEFRRIQSSLDGLVVRHGVFVVWTRDQAHTAQRLYDLTRKYATVLAETARAAAADNTGDAAADVAADGTAAADGAAIDGGAGAADGAAAEADGATAVAGGAEAEAAAAAADLFNGCLQTTLAVPAASRVAAAWGKLRGVSLPQGRVFVRGFSIAQLVCGEVPDDVVGALRTPGGRKLASGVTRMLRALARRGDLQAEEKLLAAAQNLSAPRARALLELARLHELAAMSCDELAALRTPVVVKKQPGLRALGSLAAAGVHELLHYTDG